MFVSHANEYVHFDIKQEINELLMNIDVFTQRPAAVVNWAVCMWLCLF